MHLYGQIGRRIRRSPSSMNPVVRFCMGKPQPNPKSLVLIKGLPLSITNSSLSEALAGIDARRCEVEPGCALHIVDEAAAQVAAATLRNNLGLRATVKNTALPSLALHNLPNNVSVDSLRESFSRFEPLTVRMSGKRCITITLPDAETSLHAFKLAQTISVGGRNLTGNVSRSPDGRYCIQINNIPESEDMSTVLRSVSDVVCAQFPEASLSASRGHSTVTVRLSQEAAKNYSTSALDDVVNKVI